MTDKGFEPRELKEGDVVSTNVAGHFLDGSRAVPCTNNPLVFTDGAWFLFTTLGGGGAPIGYGIGEISTHVTCVVRDGKQIYPRPEPRIRVGEVAFTTLNTPVTVVAVDGLDYVEIRYADGRAGLVNVSQLHPYVAPVEDVCAILFDRHVVGGDVRGFVAEGICDKFYLIPKDKQ